MRRFDSVKGAAKRRAWVALGLAVALAAIGGAAASAAAPGSHDATSTATGAENAFALALLPLVGGSGNVVYSPYSVDTALTMAGAGAEGSTATQIDRVVGAKSTAAASANAAALQRTMAAAAASAQSGAPKLELANAMSETPSPVNDEEVGRRQPADETMGNIGVVIKAVDLAGRVDALDLGLGRSRRVDGRDDAVVAYKAMHVAEAIDIVSGELT